MLKKTIVYENPFTKQMVSEDHYFHISKADLIEMQMENLNEPEVTNPETGQTLEGYPAMLQRIVNDRDGKEIMVVVKDMVRRAYGKKSGDRFLRSPEIWADFTSTEAWSQLYFELCTDAVAQADFMNGIFPSDMLAEANKLAAAQAKVDGKIPQPPPGMQVTVAQDSEIEEQPWNEHPEREQEVMTATTEKPVILTRADLVAMNSEDLQTGLASGRFKLS